MTEELEVRKLPWIIQVCLAQSQGFLVGGRHVGERRRGGEEQAIEKQRTDRSEDSMLLASKINTAMT